MMVWEGHTIVIIRMAGERLLSDWSSGGGPNEGGSWEPIFCTFTPKRGQISNMNNESRKYKSFFVEVLGF